MTSRRAAVGARWLALQQGLVARLKQPSPLCRHGSSAVGLQLGRRAFATGTNYNHYYFGGGFPPGGGPPRGDSEKYYSLLGVDKNASDADIKAAYKKQAMKYHPDRGGDEAKFKEISRAYEVLSNPEKRQLYDAYGEEGLDGAAGAGGQQPHVDPFDLFGQIFGFAAGGRTRRGKPITPNSEYQVQLTLEELYRGTTRTITFNRDALCGDCKGAGGQDRKKCQRCDGRGRQVVMEQLGMMVQQYEQPCAPCGGRGYIIPPKSGCSTCKTTGTVKERKSFSIQIEPGAEDGTEFRFQGQADQAYGHDTGDVVITLHELPHRTFKRIRESLVMTKKIKLAEALCGFEFTTRFLDGNDLVVRSAPGQVVKPGDVLMVPGKGMPGTKGRKAGDLLVAIEVEFPTRIAEEEQAQLAQALGGKVLPQEPSPGSAVAEKLTQSKLNDLRRRQEEARQRGKAEQQQCQFQ